MDRLPVQSSNLSTVGYDEASMTLEIEFLKGGIYQYYNVPQSEYANLMNAESKGTYFTHNIRGKYPYQKVG